MEINGYEKFIELRNWFMEKLSKADMSIHKSYEGVFEIGFSYPSYFEMNGDGTNDIFDTVTIMLHCYVIGPYRHYKWSGRTIEEAVNKARKEIESWKD